MALVIDVATWKAKDADVARIKGKYGLEEHEVHAGWLARRYVEQEKVPAFSTLNPKRRREEAVKVRSEMLIRRVALHGPESAQSLRKEFAKTDAYLHLDRNERKALLADIADTVRGWSGCCLFADCIDKRVFAGKVPTTPPFEEAFGQVVTRFHRFLEAQGSGALGMLVQDKNETVASRLTALMRRFHQSGTKWRNAIPLLIETPLFVDSRLTSLVQVSDVCAYATRRYLENSEEDLFNRVFPRLRRCASLPRNEGL